MALREDLNKLNVDSLRKLAFEARFLTTGKKKCDLIADILASTQSIRSELVGSASNLPLFHQVHYRRLPATELPDVTFTSIYKFMIKDNSGDKIAQNFKGIDKAVKHFDAGDVQNIEAAEVDDTTTYIQAYCLASMKKVKYRVNICLKKDNSTYRIEFALCQCPIGLAQACSHVGAVLLAINGRHRIQTTPGSCETEAPTSSLCRWIVPRQLTLPPKPLSSMNLSKPKLPSAEDSAEHVKKRETLNFDPRHSSDRDLDAQHMIGQLGRLKTVFPKTGIAHLWDIPEKAPDMSSEIEVETHNDPMEQLAQQMIFTTGNNLISYIEEHTRAQRDCQLWRDLHRGRLTSSIFGSVLSSGDHPSSLVRQIVEGSNLERYTNLPEAVQWGITNEQAAKTEYIKQKQVTVQETGLTLCSTHSFLGASSDGRVMDGNSVGLLEIKCPFSVNGENVTKFTISEIMGLGGKSFCLEETENGPKLKKTHKYYAQVQGELAVIGLAWCDFVLWTAASKDNMFVERVNFDSVFVTRMMPKLLQYVTKVFPNYDKTN